MATFSACLNKKLSKHSWGWWVETPTRPSWRQRNDKLCFDWLWPCAITYITEHCQHWFAQQIVTWRHKNFILMNVDLPTAGPLAVTPDKSQEILISSRLQALKCFALAKLHWPYIDRTKVYMYINKQSYFLWLFCHLDDAQNHLENL